MTNNSPVSVALYTVGARVLIVAFCDGAALAAKVAEAAGPLDSVRVELVGSWPTSLLQAWFPHHAFLLHSWETEARLEGAIVVDRPRSG